MAGTKGIARNFSRGLRSIVATFEDYLEDRRHDPGKGRGRNTGSHEYLARDTAHVGWHAARTGRIDPPRFRPRPRLPSSSRRVRRVPELLDPVSRRSKMDPRYYRHERRGNSVSRDKAAVKLVERNDVAPRIHACAIVQHPRAKGRSRVRISFIGSKSCTAGIRGIYAFKCLI